MSMRDALMKAFADKGLTLPVTAGKDRKRAVRGGGSNRQVQAVSVATNQSTGRRVHEAQRQKNKGIQTGHSAQRTEIENSSAIGRGINTPSQQARHTTSPLDTSTLLPPASPPPLLIPSVRLDRDACCLVRISGNHSFPLLDLDMAVGLRDTIDQLAEPDVHEMALGLDFGTSSVKVVIGDLAADKAYAIPFLQAEGIDAYLLPSRVFESSFSNAGGQGGVFSVTQGENAFRDLKLSLLGNPDSEERQVEVIAFLALVIQRSRAWFFHTYKSIYKRVKCLWQLRIGLPAATALDNKYVPLLERVLRAAWIVAAVNTKPDRTLVWQVRNSVFSTAARDDELEVKAIPEIAAQIFGFVVSSSFNKAAANRYLMIDVGAGTVDSSLFRVVPGRGGQWNFEFYTAVVQPYGVSNLHTHRVNWWLSKLSQIEAAKVLIQDLHASKFATDHCVALPAHNRDYFTGVHLTKNDPNELDSGFFKKLMAQVQGAAMWRAWKDGFLTQAQLTKTPMFLCGGGSRSGFYQELKTQLLHLPNYSWLSAELWQLGLPKDLIAAKVEQKDFDRLSVAYGLSKLRIGDVIRAVPLPKFLAQPQQPFTDRYIDKDQM